MPTPPKFYDPPRWTWSSCVEAAKYITGKQGVSWGAAADIKPNSPVPIIGGYGLTNEGPGHMFVVKDIFDNKVKTLECNYTPDQCESRILDIDDSDIRGWVLPSGPKNEAL